MAHTKHRLPWLTSVIALLTLLAACDELFPGLGDFEPSGTRFYLNSSIDVVAITGSLRYFSPCGQFALEMTARSTTSGRQSDNLPAGLLFTSTRNRVQHMVMLKLHPIQVPSADTLLVLGVFCCNERREIPDDEDTFAIEFVTDDPGLSELADLISDKEISGHLGMVQRAVWMITDSTGLNQAYRDSIDSLPPDTGRSPRQPEPQWPVASNSLRPGSTRPCHNPKADPASEQTAGRLEAACIQPPGWPSHTDPQLTRSR